MNYVCLRSVAVTRQRRSTRIITYGTRPVTMSEIDFPPGSRDLEADRQWQIDNRLESSEKSGPPQTATDPTAGTTVSCRPNNRDSVTDDISHDCNPDAWTPPACPNTNCPRSDITGLTTTDGNCSTAKTRQWTITAVYSPDVVQTTHRTRYTLTKLRINSRPTGLCTYTCKCCPRMAKRHKQIKNKDFNRYSTI